jgi:hypothetical protein
METNPSNSDFREEAARLRARVQDLEAELANCRHALLREFYAHRPLPVSEDELLEIVAQEKGMELESFIAELGDAARGQKL